MFSHQLRQSWQLFDIQGNGFRRRTDQSTSRYFTEHHYWFNPAGRLRQRSESTRCINVLNQNRRWSTVDVETMHDRGPEWNQRHWENQTVQCCRRTGSLQQRHIGGGLQVPRCVWVACNGDIRNRQRTKWQGQVPILFETGITGLGYRNRYHRGTTCSNSNLDSFISYFCARC